MVQSLCYEDLSGHSIESSVGSKKAFKESLLWEGVEATRARVVSVAWSAEVDQPGRFT